MPYGLSIIGSMVDIQKRERMSLNFKNILDSKNTISGSDFDCSHVYQTRYNSEV